MRTVILLAVLIAAPALAAAQTPLRLQRQAGDTSVAGLRFNAGTAYPIRALDALGARVSDTARGVRVEMFGTTLTFETGSPFFLDGSRVQQLHAPAFRDPKGFFVPEQFFIEWLPSRFGDRLTYARGALRTSTEPVAAAPPREQPREPAVTRSPQPVDTAAHAKRVVILDAGHGGRDPGKIGPNGLREKDVALQVTQRLAALLRERDYEVFLTRSRDTLIALADRPRFANQWKAGRPSSLYMSIHANAGVSAARGFETYFLSDARTEDERRVAEMENAATSFEEKSTTPAPELDHILNNLRNDFYVKASNDLAEVVQKRLSNFHPGPNRGVKQAGFRVLVGAFMPAVLVETAFISNPHEANLLGSSQFQQKIALALAEAVDTFFDAHEHLWATAK